MKGVTLMSLNVSDVRVGERIRRRRQQLGKPLRVIAGLAGINHSTLSRIERGEIAGNNRFQIAAIAAALKCPVDHLTGVAVPAGRHGAETTGATYDTVRALITADLEFPPPADGDTHPITALTDRVGRAVKLRQHCDYAALTRELPTLVADLYTATGGPDRGTTLTLMVRIAEAASFTVRYTGNPAAASIAAERARQAAAYTDDPVMVAFGEWARAHAALGCGLHERAVIIAERAAHDLAATTCPDRDPMLGMLHLTTAFSLVGAGRPADAAAPLAEASVLARHTGETDTLALMFGPTNVRLWEMAILVDGGDPLDAIEVASNTNPLLIPSPSRQATFYLDQGRCLGKLGEVDRAVKSIEAAERIAPQRVHGDPLVVETVAGLLDAAHRRTVGLRLRGLCERVGVAA